MTAPGSNSQLQGSTPAMPWRIMGWLLGDVKGPTGDFVLFITPTLPPPLAK